MKYVTIPEPVEMADGTKLSLPQFLADMIWTRPGWRDPQAPQRLELLLTLAPKFKGKRPGTLVELSDVEHEALARESAMQDMQIQPAAVLPLAKLQLAVARASGEPPAAQTTRAERRRAVRENGAN